MSEQKFIFEKAKRKAKIEQTVRGFLNLMDENDLDMEDGRNTMVAGIVFYWL